MDREKPIVQKLKIESKEIFLFVLSIVQGLSFEKLLEVTINEMDKGISTTLAIVILVHAFVGFGIIIRMFEALYLAFLDYDDIVKSAYGIMVVFVIGAFEYLLISRIQDFSHVQFYIMLLTFSGLSLLGFSIALISISSKKNRKNLFDNRSLYERELILQSINIFVAFTVSVMSVFVIINENITKQALIIVGSVTFVFISINAYSTWHITFTSPKNPKPWRKE